MTSPTEPIAPDVVLGTAATRRPTLTLDVALYDRYLEDGALSENDRRAVLESLWAIIVGFVDLGFAVEPADKSGGGNAELASGDSALVESSLNSTTDHFEKAAAHIASSGD